MPKTSPFDSINQNLDTLSLDELLEVRATVDALIAKKVLETNEGARTLPGVSRVSTIIGTTTYPLSNALRVSLLSQGGTIFHFAGHGSRSESQVLQPSGQLVDREDDSLETVISLVDEWMNDESGYDKEAYPQIEEGLKQNRTSL